MRDADNAAAAPRLAAAFARALDRNWELLTPPRRFAAAVGGFVALSFLLRYALFPGASSDDAEMLVLTQSFEGLYKAGQPPLLNWVLAAIFAVTGPQLAVVILVKGLLVLALYLLLYGAARELLADPRRAALAALSPILIYLVVWDGLLNYSHTIFMTTLAAAALYVTLRLRRAPAAWRYALVGLVLGLGLQAKYNFAIFAAGLLAAALVDAPLRARLRDRRALITAAVAAVVAAPHFIWLYINRAAVERAFEAAFQPAITEGPFEGVLAGLFSLADGIVGFLLPLPLVLAALFPEALRPLRGVPAERRWGERLLLAHMLAMLAVLAGAVLLAGVTHFRNHYFFIFIVFPLWYFARLEAATVREASLKRYAGAITGFAAVAILAIFGKAVIDPWICKRCYLHIPYPRLAEQIRAAGFEHGTIILRSPFVQIGGNLRDEFPRARVVPLRTNVTYRPPPRGRDGQCLLLWSEDVLAGDVRNLKAFAAAVQDVAVPADAPVQVAEAPYAFAPSRRYRLSFILLPEGSGDCR